MHDLEVELEVQCLLSIVCQLSVAPKWKHCSLLPSHPFREGVTSQQQRCGSWLCPEEPWEPGPFLMLRVHATEDGTRGHTGMSFPCTALVLLQLLLLHRLFAKQHPVPCQPHCPPSPLLLPPTGKGRPRDLGLRVQLLTCVRACHLRWWGAAAEYRRRGRAALFATTVTGPLPALSTCQRLQPPPASSRAMQRGGTGPQDVVGPDDEPRAVTPGP